MAAIRSSRRTGGSSGVAAIRQPYVVDIESVNRLLSASADAAHPCPTVHHIRVAGDPARCVGREEGDEVGDVLRVAEALGRQLTGEPLAEVLDEVRGEVGV